MMSKSMRPCGSDEEEKMKKILTALIVAIIAGSGLWASAPSAEICPVCLFPHEGWTHMDSSAVPEPPVMHEPVIVLDEPGISAAIPEDGGLVSDDRIWTAAAENDVTFTLSAGFSMPRLMTAWWLDCLAPVDDDSWKSDWIVDARGGMLFSVKDDLRIGFETGAILHLDGDEGVSSYDIPAMAKLSWEPQVGILSFPVRLGSGLFTGFSPVTRETTVGVILDASIGIQLELGGGFILSLDTRADAQMRLDIKNGFDSRIEVMWIPAVLTLGVRF